MQLIFYLTSSGAERFGVEDAGMRQSAEAIASERTRPAQMAGQRQGVAADERLALNR